MIYIYDVRGYLMEHVKPKIWILSSVQEGNLEESDHTENMKRINITAPHC